MTTSLFKMTVVLMTLGTSGVAIAESPNRAARTVDPAEVVVEVTHQTAEAPASPALERKVDPLEAALAQAMALSAAPVELAPDPAPAARRDGLDTLHRHTRDAATVGLDRRRARARSTPSGETPLRLDVQPLDPRLVSKLVKDRLEQVHYCHESLVARGLAQGGQVTMHFVIEPRGHVSTASVTAGGEHADQLEQCMVQQMRRWKFPAADAPTMVDYPIVFDVAGSTLAK